MGERRVNEGNRELRYKIKYFTTHEHDTDIIEQGWLVTC